MDYTVFGEELGFDYGFRLSQWSLELSWNGCHQLWHFCPILILLKNELRIKGWNPSVWPPFLIFIFNRFREKLKTRLQIRAKLDKEIWLITLFSCRQWWGEIYLKHWIFPLHGGLSFYLSYPMPQHGLWIDVLIVCKIYSYDFWYYPNLFSLAFKGSVHK